MNLRPQFRIQIRRMRASVSPHSLRTRARPRPRSRTVPIPVRSAKWTRGTRTRDGCTLPRPLPCERRTKSPAVGVPLPGLPLRRLRVPARPCSRAPSRSTRADLWMRM
ncbi:hypothetical protein L226DRAFT_372749 [Lentinus tigrinus ALCF2SS1-7]|uniref:uncharacterized protein n=1 Tax=Lentinus tigrinus ALCF2SS1-7 TaxID=1328758 RepID=UPI001165D39A|nr:hypothetical protein L226DRAFT_372749 [Lentinus tigrinus ALCF2SS1-7]